MCVFVCVCVCRNPILVRETDPRHGGVSIFELEQECEREAGAEVSAFLFGMRRRVITYERDRDFQALSIKAVLREVLQHEGGVHAMSLASGALQLVLPDELTSRRLRRPSRMIGALGLPPPVLYLPRALVERGMVPKLQAIMTHTRIVSASVPEVLEPTGGARGEAGERQQKQKTSESALLSACMAQCSYVALYLNKKTFSGDGAEEVAAAVRWCSSTPAGPALAPALAPAPAMTPESAAAAAPALALASKLRRQASAPATTTLLPSSRRVSNAGPITGRVILLHELSVAADGAPFADIMAQFPLDAQFLLKQLALGFNTQTPELLHISAFKIMQKMHSLEEHERRKRPPLSTRGVLQSADLQGLC